MQDQLKKAQTNILSPEQTGFVKFVFIGISEQLNWNKTRLEEGLLK